MQNYADNMRDFVEKHATGLAVALVAGKCFSSLKDIVYSVCLYLSTCSIMSVQRKLTLLLRMPRVGI